MRTASKRPRLMAALALVLGLPLMLLGLRLLLGLRPAWAEESVTGEALVKIQFIERFTRFVEWPADVLNEGQRRFVICIAGVGPVANLLPEEAIFETFKGKPAEFRQVKTGDDLGACHLLFIGASEEFRLAALLAGTATRPILTVADIGGAGKRGVLINFYREGERVKFEINRAAVERSGLKFSSRLVRLARVVEQESR